VQVTLAPLSGANTYSVRPALFTRMLPRPRTVLDEIPTVLPCAVVGVVVDVVGEAVVEDVDVAVAGVASAAAIVPTETWLHGTTPGILGALCPA
jgi:hypothetical protein